MGGEGGVVVVSRVLKNGLPQRMAVMRSPRSLGGVDYKQKRTTVKNCEFIQCLTEGCSGGSQFLSSEKLFEEVRQEPG